LQAPFGYGPGGIERIRPGEEVRGKPAQTLGRQPRAGSEADLRDHNEQQYKIHQTSHPF
jgi:hypothetical protein